MKFTKSITVEIEAEPTSEEWYIQITASDCDNFTTKHCATYEEAFNDLPVQYRDITKKAFAQKLDKRYKNSSHQFWSLYEHNEDHSVFQQACICHYYHFDCDYSTHINF